MTRSTAILGKGGVGKTFLAAHLAKALGYLGVKTLVVGCDQKQDLVRALSAETRGNLGEWLFENDDQPQRVAPEDVLVPVDEYVDALELGPSPILVGHYGAVLDEAFAWFAAHDLPDRYEHVIFDVTEERWDGTLSPLYHRVGAAVAVTHETPESLFVLNRLFRAVQIGGHEFKYPMVTLGVVNNASREPAAFERYVKRTQCFPLLTIPDLPELAALRPFHRTLFELKSLPEHLLAVQDGLVKVADLMRGNPMNLFPVATLNDQDIWELAPPASLPS